MLGLFQERRDRNAHDLVAAPHGQARIQCRLDPGSHPAFEPPPQAPATRRAGPHARGIHLPAGSARRPGDGLDDPTLRQFQDRIGRRRQLLGTNPGHSSCRDVPAQFNGQPYQFVANCPCLPFTVLRRSHERRPDEEQAREYAKDLARNPAHKPESTPSVEIFARSLLPHPCRRSHREPVGLDEMKLVMPRTGPRPFTRVPSTIPRRKFTESSKKSA